MSTQSGDLTVQELAIQWRCKPATVRELIRKGDLPATFIAGRWLIAPADAETYRKARMNVAPTKPQIRRRRSA